MIENEDMSKDTEIALVGHEVKELNKKVDGLKTTFKEMVNDIHGHITREYNLVSRENDNKLQLAVIESERKTAKETDDKIKANMATIKALFAGLVATVILAYGSFIFITSQKEPTKTEENLISIEKANSIYETVAREIGKQHRANMKAANMKATKTETETIE